MVRSGHARRIGRRIHDHSGVRGPTGRARPGRRAAAPTCPRNNRRPSRVGASPSYSCPPATAAGRPPFRRSSIPSAAWRTDAPPARGRSASTRCTTGCWRCSTSSRRRGAFATHPFLAPAPLAPTGRGVPTGGGVRLTGRWSWATGVMHGNWIIVGALCGPEEDPAAIYPALALLRAGDFQIEDVWHTDGMRATGSNDVVITDAFVPGHRLVRVSDIYTGTAPGAGLHDADTYRWPWPYWRPCPRSAVPNAQLYAERLSQRVLAYEGVMQKDKPIAQAHLAEARVRLR